MTIYYDSDKRVIVRSTILCQNVRIYESTIFFLMQSNARRGSAPFSIQLSFVPCRLHGLSALAEIIPTEEHIPWKGIPSIHRAVYSIDIRYVNGLHI